MREKDIEREITAIAYHELKNPLNGTVGYLRLAHQQLGGGDGGGGDGGAGDDGNGGKGPGDVVGKGRALDDVDEVRVHVADALSCCESALGKRVL